MMMNISPSHHHHHHHLPFHQSTNNKSDHHLDDPEWFVESEKKNNLGSTTSNPQPRFKITFFLSFDCNKDHNNNDVHDHGKQQKKPLPHLCRVCNRAFSSDRALNGHKRWHTEKGSKKGTSTTSSLSEQNKSSYDDQDQLPVTDLSRFLPPRNYKTNIRSKRFVIDDDVRDVAQSLLDMSRGKSLCFNVDNHPDYRKRLKLSHERTRC